MAEAERDQEAGKMHPFHIKEMFFAFVLAEQGIQPGLKKRLRVVSTHQYLERGQVLPGLVGRSGSYPAQKHLSSGSESALLLSSPHVLLQRGWRHCVRPLQSSDVLGHQRGKVQLSGVIACLRGESICTANGHLHNPVSFHWLSSTVGLPRGAAGEELGNKNSKMTSSRRAPFSTYCWLPSWLRADKQIWPGCCCSICWWHQQGRIGNLSRGGRCGCDPCHPLPAGLTAGACSPWQKPKAKLIVINFDYSPFPLKWLSRWICPMRALKGKLLTSASANASSRFISDIPF